MFIRYSNNPLKMSFIDIRFTDSSQFDEVYKYN